MMWHLLNTMTYSQFTIIISIIILYLDESYDYINLCAYISLGFIETWNTWVSTCDSKIYNYIQYIYIYNS